MLTRAVLLGTLAGTALAVTDVLRRSELEPRTAAMYLLLFTLLFFVRIAGQLLVWRRSPNWLPPMREWNLVPYPVLLPIQLVFLATMTAIAVTLERVDSRPSFGRVLIGLAILYVAAMVVRYAVRMRRRPEAQSRSSSTSCSRRSCSPGGAITARADVIVVGAGASGLSVAAVLARRSRHAIVLERDERVGATWARRYDRLSLHTTRRFSGLPFYPLPRSLPRYVPKDLYARYLAGYVQRADLDVRLDSRVERVQPSASGWRLKIAARELETRAVVLATGRHSVPQLPDWPGAGDYSGRLLHSSDYATGAEFAGKQVLVVGIGNSGAEIAVDLVEQGAVSVSIAVRSRPPIISREIAGIPVQLFGMALHPFPAFLVDRLGKAMRRLANGDLGPYGLGEEEWGPFAERRPPVIDVGFLRELKAGRIKVLPAVISVTQRGVVTADGQEHPFDLVVAATGFTTGLERLVDAPEALDERGYPRPNHAASGLFFAGYSETPRGQLFEANRGARHLAATIDDYLSKGS